MTTEEHPYLIFHGGKEHGKSVPVRTRLILGREPENDIVVDDLGVSGQHAAILPSEDGHYIRDLSSSTGTFVNRQNITVTDHLLQQGDQIQLGASEVVFLYSMHASSRVATWPPENLAAGLQERDQYFQETPSSSIADAVGEGLTDGDIVLKVRAEGNVGMTLINFVKELRNNPPFRFLRLASQRDGSINIWLSLRWPMSVPQVLGESRSVAEVSPVKIDDEDSGNDEFAFNVLLR